MYRYSWHISVTNVKACIESTSSQTELSDQFCHESCYDISCIRHMLDMVNMLDIVNMLDMVNMLNM